MFPSIKSILVISLIGDYVGAALIRKVEQKEDAVAKSFREGFYEDEIDWENATPIYAYDVSYPMFSKNVSTNYPWLRHNTDPDNHPTPKEYENVPIQPLGDRQTFYEKYMQGCRDFWGGKGKNGECDRYESQRIEHNIRQPPGMMNYTDVGYKKIKCPEHVFKLLADFWEANKQHEGDEGWEPGNIFSNYWESDAKFVNLQDSKYVGGGEKLMDEIWDLSVQTISEWTGQKLIPSSPPVYGIRVYKEGAVLASHVDRLPLISSAIINVAQDVDEPWGLEVIGHDGVAKNITMEPGDMVMYEGHSVIHGRPFPLRGRFYANAFIHFEPDPDTSNHGDLPPYIVEGSLVAEDFRAGEYKGDIPSEVASKLQRKRELESGILRTHHAAGDGDLKKLKEIAKTNHDSLFKKDMNGWQPIHEAARSGFPDVVEFLHSQGADINARTYNGDSPLSLVDHFHGEEHDLYHYLLDLGATALDLGPDL